MFNNKKITDLVRADLENDLYLIEILKEGMVNYTALSRKLLPKIKVKNSNATLGAISMAIKRYVSTEKKKKLADTIKKIIANSQLSTKNDLVHMTFKRNDKVLNRVSEISKKIRWDQEEIFFVNQGSGEVTIILEEKNKNLLSDCKKDLIESTSDLAMLSIRESSQKDVEKSIDIPGVYAYFINQLSRRSINIIEIVSTFSQLSFVLKNDDLMKAYSALEANIRYFRENV